MVFKKIIIDGKRISNSKLDTIMNEATDIIIMSGFSTISELEKIIKINARDNEYLVDAILYKLQITYANMINHQSDKSLTEKTACANVGLLIDKQMLILELIHRRRDEQLESYDPAKSDDENCIEDDFYTDYEMTKEEKNLSMMMDKLEYEKSTPKLSATILELINHKPDNYPTNIPNARVF